MEYKVNYEGIENALYHVADTFKQSFEHDITDVRCVSLDFGPTETLVSIKLKIDGYTNLRGDRQFAINRTIYNIYDDEIPTNYFIDGNVVYTDDRNVDMLTHINDYLEVNMCPVETARQITDRCKSFHEDVKTKLQELFDKYQVEVSWYDITNNQYLPRNYTYIQDRKISAPNTFYLGPQARCIMSGTIVPKNTKYDWEPGYFDDMLICKSIDGHIRNVPTVHLSFAIEDFDYDVDKLLAGELEAIELNIRKACSLVELGEIEFDSKN